MRANLSYSITFGFYISNPRDQYKNQIVSFEYKTVMASVGRRFGKQSLALGLMYGMARPNNGHSLVVI